MRGWLRERTISKITLLGNLPALQHNAYPAYNYCIIFPFYSLLTSGYTPLACPAIRVAGSDAEAALVNNIGGYALPPSIGGNCTSTLADVPPLYEDR